MVILKYYQWPYAISFPCDFPSFLENKRGTTKSWDKEVVTDLNSLFYFQFPVSVITAETGNGLGSGGRVRRVERGLVLVTGWNVELVAENGYEWWNEV